MRVWVVIAMMIVAAALVSTAAVTWEEQASGPQFRVHPDSGETQVAFYVVMGYTPIPECLHLDIEWTVGVVQGSGVETLATSHYPKPLRCGRYLTVSALSPFVTVVPGETHAAALVLRDTRNGLTHCREFRYVAPLTVPIGVALAASTADGEDETTDWSGVSDDDLATLASYYEAIQGFAEEADGLEPDVFFATIATDPDRFPAWVVVLSPVDAAISVAGGGLSLTFTANRTLLLYEIPSSAAVPETVASLAEVGEGWTGRGLVRTSGAGVPAAALVEADAWQALQEAVREQERRED